MDEETHVRRNTYHTTEFKDSKRLHVNNYQRNEKREQKCWLCHNNISYGNVQHVQERKLRVQEANACFNCLKKGHLRKNCLRNKSCETNGCKCKHSFLLHEDVNSNTKTNLVRNEEENRHDTNTMAVNAGNKCGIHLPIVKVYVYNEHGDRFLANALLDSGSTQSLVRKAFANKVGFYRQTRKDLI